MTKDQNKPIIAWEKFKSPFEEIQEKLIKKLNNNIIDMDDETEEEDEDDGYDKSDYHDSYEIQEEKTEQMMLFMKNGIPIIHDMFKGFNVWTGHTTIPVSDFIGRKICNIRGVETFNPVSPYRIHVGVGKLFKPSEVLPKIDKLFINMHNSGLVYDSEE